MSRRVRLLLAAAALGSGIPAAVAYSPWVEALSIPTGQHQLFLDDYVLGHISGVERVIHPLRKYPGNMVIRPDLPSDGLCIQMRDAPSWDDREKVWKAWYITGGDAGGAAYATSRDGIHWVKPMLGLVDFKGSRRNNLVMVKGHPDGQVIHVLIDPDAPPESRYKAMIGWVDLQPAISADGLVFTQLPVPGVPSEDESHLNWDAGRREYLFSVKHDGPFGRSVYLTTSRDYIHWSPQKLIYFADSHDQALGAEYIRQVEANPRMWRPTINHPSEYNTEIYNMPVFPYEGMYIGLPNYFESSGHIPPPRGNQDGVNSPKLACSRDLISWTRVGDRRHFLPVSERGPGVLDTGQVFAASHPIRHGDELWFYYTGIDVRYRPGVPNIEDEFHGGIYLAKLRLDGFVSFHAGAAAGVVETRPVLFQGNRLYVNVAATGRLRAEITDRSGRKVLPGWGREQCRPMTGDSLHNELRWDGHDGVGDLRGQIVRIRFLLENADLYSFEIDL